LTVDQLAANETKLSGDSSFSSNDRLTDEPTTSSACLALPDPSLIEDGGRKGWGWGNVGTVGREDRIAI
jgi:hypothetical protein